MERQGEQALAYGGICAAWTAVGVALVLAPHGVVELAWAATPNAAVSSFARLLGCTFLLVGVVANCLQVGRWRRRRAHPPSSQHRHRLPPAR